MDFCDSFRQVTDQQFNRRWQKEFLLALHVADFWALLALPAAIDHDQVLQEQPTQIFWNLIREECECNRSLKGLRHKHTNECQIFKKVSAVLNGATNEPELKGPKQKKIKKLYLIPNNILIL